MNRAVCIHPRDLTTEFLTPVYNAFMEYENIFGIAGDSTEDLFYDNLEASLDSNNTHSLIFLGHGYSSALYGNGFSELITEHQLRAINDKTFILFACNSSQLLKKISAKTGIGFGFIPSGQDDILHSPKFHNLDLSSMELTDWDCLRDAYQRCWVRALKSHDNLLNVYGLYKGLNLYFNRAIIEVLMDTERANRKLISNILYYVKSEMIFYEA